MFSLLLTISATLLLRMEGNKMTIVYLNVTKKDLTETQKDAGCVDFNSQEKEELKILLSSLDNKKK